VTTSTLLDALRGYDNRTVWAEFDAHYRRLIERVAARLGLSPEEASEAAQQTLADFAEGYRTGNYDRSRGRLSSWLLAIARNRIMDVHRSRRRRQARGSSALVDIAVAEVDPLWEQEHEQLVLERALLELREESRTEPRTLRVFEQVALQGAAPDRVAQEHALSVEHVYRIKSRITERLRAIVERVHREHTEA
jgi:RNA polymerase sigma factor (sigma-70 family)